MSTMRERFNAEFPVHVDSVHGERILNFARSEVCLGVDDLEKRIAELQAEAEKKKHGHAGALRELERLRKFAVQVGDAALASGDEIRVRLTSALVNLDRASHAQSDPQPGATPCAK